MKKRVVLHIDTKDSHNVIVELDKNGKKRRYLKRRKAFTSQVLLPLVDEILRKNNIKVLDLTEIKVHPGPGSFTGLRVGAAVANTLGALLNIPVNGQKGKIVEPVYNLTGKLLSGNL